MNKSLVLALSALLLASCSNKDEKTQEEKNAAAPSSGSPTSSIEDVPRRQPYVRPFATAEDNATYQSKTPQFAKPKNVPAQAPAAQPAPEVKIAPYQAVAVNPARRACVIQSNWPSPQGAARAVKTCLDNTGVEATQFEQLCQIVSALNMPQGSTSQLSYQTACPTSAQAVCQNVASWPTSIYYYDRSASELGDGSACASMKGAWKTPQANS